MALYEFLKAADGNDRDEIKRKEGSCGFESKFLVGIAVWALKNAFKSRARPVHCANQKHVRSVPEKRGAIRYASHELRCEDDRLTDNGLSILLVFALVLLFQV